MPRSGEVGAGSQNSYQSQGTIFQKDPVPGKNLPYPIRFKKSNRNRNTDRNQSECWNAGTPITWGDEVKIVKGTIGVPARDPGYPQVTEVLCTAEDGYQIKILASLDEKGNAKEFHPLIQFYNEILARLFTDPSVDGRKMLDGLKTEASALKLWRYLEHTYLHDSAHGENGKSKKIKNGKSIKMKPTVKR